MSISVADVVLSRALASGSEDTQNAAATVLLQHADQIERPGIIIWPIPNFNWRSDLPSNSRLGLVQAAAKWMKSQLAKNKNVLPSAAEVLFKALDDPDLSVNDIAAASLRPMIQAFPPSAGFYTDDALLSFKQIAERLAQARIPQEPITNEAARVETDIREVLSATAAAPVSKDRSQTLGPPALLRPVFLRLGEFLTAMGASNRTR